LSDTPASSSPRFRGAGALEWAHWEEESVLYDPRSGRTHLLDPVSSEVLVALQERPRTAEELAGHLAGLLGHEADENLGLQVSDALQQLLALGLVEG
jgi:PqqD family protein of HPr-rel-A system